MSRIHGYFNAAVTPNEVRTVAALQRHGGPDGTFLTRGPDWGLGTNLLTTDHGGGMTPSPGIDARISAVFDGEIYNHDELRGDLRRRGYQFDDRSTGAVIRAL